MKVRDSSPAVPAAAIGRCTSPPLRLFVTPSARSLALLLVSMLWICVGTCGRLAAQPSALGVVMALANQPDSQNLVGGTFAYLNGVRLPNLGRLSADGMLDSSFIPRAQGWVYSVVVNWDEKILVGGFFPGPNAESRFNLRRLNSDGTTDDSFGVRAKYIQSGDLQGVVAAVVLQPDGRILVGGGFDKLAGRLCRNIGRLYADGTPDVSFNSIAKGGIGAFVSSIALQTDGRILVGGSFKWLGGRSCTNIGRLNVDGTLDTSFRAKANNVVRTVCLQPDGRILLGGIFDRVNGRVRPFLARLLPDGDLDTAFNAGFESPPPIASVNGPGVYSIGLQADGRMMVGGRFARVGGFQRKYLARINGDGTLDPSFNASISGEISTDPYLPIAPAVYALAVQEDGGVLFGGHFSRVNGEIRQNLATWHGPEPACVESLELDMNRQVATWGRCGNSPELESVIFEQSADGTNYVFLGFGRRIFGGWEIRDLTLPPSPFTMRVRGRSFGGVGNRSSGLVSLRAEF